MKPSRTKRFAVAAATLCMALLLISSAAAQLSGAQPNRRASVTGRLQLAGSNYFRDPRFVIVDDAGNKVFISMWAPLEIPPPMPGKETPRAKGPVTMDDYLGKRLTITGTYRSGKQNAAQARVVSGRNLEDFLEVESVTDASTARQVFAAQPIPGGPGEPQSGKAMARPRATDPPNDASPPAASKPPLSFKTKPDFFGIFADTPTVALVA